MKLRHYHSSTSRQSGYHRWYGTNVFIFLVLSSVLEKCSKMVRINALSSFLKAKEPEIFTVENSFRRQQSMVCIQSDFEGRRETSIVIPAPAGQDSSPEPPHPQTWMNGIFACLRPVLSIIGKGVIENTNVTDNWEIPLESITDLVYVGCGGQGAVFSGIINNTPVAVKKVADLKESDIKNLRKLNHPNIVKFKGICIEERCFCIVMEFCPYGSLFDLLKKQKNVMTINRVVTWAKQIANGMHYLHTHKIIHRDLKSPNVLIGEKEIIKISDFGTSRTFNGVSEKMSFAGTVAWMAPEALQEKACSEKVDIWSFGVVLWELLTCEIPYDGMEQSAIMFSVGSGKLSPHIPSTCPDGFKLIMQICWKFNPKERPSFKLILNHLEIASADILSKYQDTTFFKTQESWKEEIKSQVTQFVQLQKHKYQDQLSEEQMQKRKELEIQRIREVREMYVNKLQKVEDLYNELQKQVIGRKRRLLPQLVKRYERRRSYQSTTPTSPDQSLTSPDSPQKAATRVPIYAKLNTATTTVTTQTTLNSRKRHHRNSLGSPGKMSSSRKSLKNNSYVVVDAGTQTDSMDISETDLSPTASSTASFPQKVILQEYRNGSEDEGEGGNGNYVHLHYMASHPHNNSQLFTKPESRTSSPDFDETDTVNKNISQSRVSSSDELLETLSKKVSEIKISGRLSENGNVEDRLGPIRKRTTSESRREFDSTEDVGNEESPSDEDNDLYNHSLRRRSLARRPIYPGRRINRHKTNPNPYQQEPNASDEGNTSEYSVSPSSKSSTLESNPDRTPRRMSNMAKKRQKPTSDGSSDSDSEEHIMTVIPQGPYTTENLV